VGAASCSAVALIAMATSKTSIHREIVMMTPPETTGRRHLANSLSKYGSYLDAYLWKETKWSKFDPRGGDAIPNHSEWKLSFARHVHPAYPMYMALHIQDRETDRLARELSAATGETITQAVNTALRERLHSVSLPPKKSKEEIIAAIEEVTAHLATLPVLDTRSEDEILGYNEHGSFD